MQNPLLFLLFLCVLGTDLQAQAPEYNSGEDGFRYRENSNMTILMTAPSGQSIPIDMVHSSTISIVFVAPDTALALYDSLTLSMSSPGVKKKPHTESLIGQHFLLSFPKNGKIQTLSSPIVPKGIQELRDINLQFFDFFLPLPEKELKKGLTWVDNHREEPEVGLSIEKQGIYEVVGDSLIGGEQIIEISAFISLNLNLRKLEPSSGVAGIANLSGMERSTFWFSPSRGMMIRRASTGNLGGSLTVEGGLKALSIPQSISYDHAIELIE